MNSCLMAASISLSGCHFAGICSECCDALNLWWSLKVCDTDILPKTPLFALSLCFHPYFTMLEDKVRIQD